MIALDYTDPVACAPDLVANPAVLLDPDGRGRMLSWACCGRQWYLTPADDAPHRTYQAWHFVAVALSR